MASITLSCNGLQQSPYDFDELQAQGVSGEGIYVNELVAVSLGFPKPAFNLNDC